MREKLHDTFLFNFLANDAKNAADIMEAGKGYVVPGIASDQFPSVEAAASKVAELKQVTDTISIGLGGGGDITNWKKVLDIALVSNAGHLNQPFEKAAYTKGYLDGNGKEQMVNALVHPTGVVGEIQLPGSNKVLPVEQFLEIASAIGIESVKLMPVHGTQHLDELIYLTAKASEYGIRGIEPAGGIHADNIAEIIQGVKNIDIALFMPHIFGSAIDAKTGNTIPETVNEIYKKVEGIL